MFDDQYLLLADYQSYVDCQDEVDRAFLDPEPLDPHVHPEHGPHGQIFLGPRDPGIQREDLESKTL